MLSHDVTKTKQGSSDVISTANQRVTTEPMKTNDSETMFEVENSSNHQGANFGTAYTVVKARMVDNVPKSDLKHSSADGDNAKSGVMESGGEEKEDDLDTLEMEYNEEYYIDSDGLQRYDSDN